MVERKKCFQKILWKQKKRQPRVKMTSKTSNNGIKYNDYIKMNEITITPNDEI